MMDETGPGIDNRSQVPQIYAEKMKAARARRSMQGERRVVTILFCDVSGSTEFAGELDPEIWAEIMHEAFDYLVAPIYRYEGTVARLMGDAILAFFGAPIAHEDDAERAVLDGLDILSGVEPFAAEIEKEFGRPFHLRVGINTGPVVVGEIGSDLAMEYTAMGDAANLAARMEQTAAPGTVQVSEETYRRLVDRFEFEDLGPIELKGKGEPVRAYQALRPKEGPSLARSLEGLSSPLVGREGEMERLWEAITGLEGGRGGVLTLLGEAGLGKSRLIQELHSRSGEAGEERLAWYFSTGISYNMALPFGVFRPMLRGLIGAEGWASAERTRQGVDRFVQAHPEGQQEGMRLAIELILGLELEPDVLAMDAERRKREVFQAMEGLLRELAARASMVLVLDDLHWADPASIGLITHLFRLTDELPVLFLCSLRPHRDSEGWQVKLKGETRYPHRYQEINLRPLSSEASDRLIEEILATTGLPAHLHQLIRSKAEGNPLFVEEVIRMLIEQGILVREGEENRWVAQKDPEPVIIPDTLQALLTARIDRLPAEVRTTLQVASVIGRSFHQQVLEAVRSVNGNLQRHLSALQRHELIRETVRIPQVEYSFHHELTRDAAYSTVLRRQRRRYHRQVGEALERLYQDRREEFAGRLGYHFEMAGESARALQHYTTAGDQAARLYANQEAVEYYRRAVRMAEGTGLEAGRWADLMGRLGRVYEVMGRYERALDLHRKVTERGVEGDDPQLELEGLLRQLTLYSVPTAVQERAIGSRLAERALAIATELEDPEAQAKTLWNMLLQQFYLGLDFQKGLEYGERALKLAREHDLEELLPFILNDLSRAYSSNHQTRESMEAQREAEAIWREQGNLNMLPDNLTTAANHAFDRGELGQAAELAEEALEISRKVDNLWGQAYSMMIYGGILVERGQVSRGIRMLEEARRVGHEGSFFAASMFTPLYLAWTYANLGAADLAEQQARQAVEAMQALPAFMARAEVILARTLMLKGEDQGAAELIARNREHLEQVIPALFAGALTWLIVGQVLLLEGDPEGALEMVARLEAFAQRKGGLWCLPEALILKARSHNALGEEAAGDRALRQAGEVSGRMESPWSRLRALAALKARFGPERGEAEARGDQEEAQAIIEGIEASIQGEELIRSFRQSELVRQLRS